MSKGEIPETLDELGAPGWYLFDPKDMMDYCRSIPVMGQRGCPFGCTFCSRPYGKTVRQRTPACIVDEIEEAIKLFPASSVSWVESASGLNVSKDSAGDGHFSKYRVRFFDETFSVNKIHTIALCQEIIDRGLHEKIEWRSLVHANTIDDKVAFKMAEAGCVHVGYGVESGDPEILKRMNKGINIPRLKKAREVLKRAKINCIAFFIFGHPFETRRSIWRTIKLAIELNAEETAFGIMVPYPGTEIWDMALKGEGGYKKLSPSWDDYNKQLGNAVDFEGINRKEVEFYQLFASALIYILNFRFRDLFRQVRQHFGLILSILFKIVTNRSGGSREKNPNYKAYL